MRYVVIKTLKNQILKKTCESNEELKIPQEYDDGGIIILSDLREKQMHDPQKQAMVKRSKHKNLSIFIISQYYYELPKRTIRTTGKVYHIFKPNNFRDFQNLHQDKATMDLNFNKYKYLTSTCWDKKYQTFTIDTTKHKYIGSYR